LKRWIALILAVCLSLPLAACSNDEPAAETTPEPTGQPPIEAFITPEPTPYTEEDPVMQGEEAQQVLTGSIGGGEGALKPQAETPPGAIVFTTDAPEELPGEEGAQAEPTQEPWEMDPYSYSSLTNQRLLIKFLYPEGWESEPSTDTITMVEPVAEGEVPARFSVTSFEYSYYERDISTGRLKDHLTDYVKTLVTGYNDYQLGSTGYDMTFADSTAIYATYLAIKGNSFIQGIAIVGYGKNGRVYCMHFCCEQDDYEGHEPLIERLASFVTPIND